MSKKSIISISVVVSCMSIAFIWAIIYSSIQLYNKVNETPTDNISHSNNNRIIYDNDGNYIKIQNRMSMDWSASDKDWLLLIMDLSGGTIEDRATSMIIALDCVANQDKSIPQYTIDTFGPAISLQYKDIESDEKAYDLVVNRGWDETGTIERDGVRDGKENN